MNNTQQLPASTLSVPNLHSLASNPHATVTENQASGVDRQGHNIGYSTTIKYLSEGAKALSSGVSLLTRPVRSIAVSGLQLGGTLLGKAAVWNEILSAQALSSVDPSTCHELAKRQNVTKMLCVDDRDNPERQGLCQNANKTLMNDCWSNNKIVEIIPPVGLEMQCDGRTDVATEDFPYGSDETYYELCNRKNKCEEINQASTQARVFCEYRTYRDNRGLCQLLSHVQDSIDTYCKAEGENLIRFDVSPTACHELAQQQSMTKILCVDDTDSPEPKGLCQNANTALIYDCRSNGKTVEIIPPVGVEKQCDGLPSTPTALFLRGSDEARELCTPKKCEEINQVSPRMICHWDRGEHCLSNTQDNIQDCTANRRGRVIRFDQSTSTTACRELAQLQGRTKIMCVDDPDNLEPQGFCQNADNQTVIDHCQSNNKTLVTIPPIETEKLCDGRTDCLITADFPDGYDEDRELCTPEKCQQINQISPRILCGPENHCLEDNPMAIQHCQDAGRSVTYLTERTTAVINDTHYDGSGSGEYDGGASGEYEGSGEAVCNNTKLPTEPVGNLTTPASDFFFNEETCDTSPSHDNIEPEIPHAEPRTQPESSFPWNPVVAAGLGIAGLSVFSYLTYRNAKALAQQQPLSCRLIGEAAVKTLTNPFFYRHSGTNAVANQCPENA